jgi:hypothetical protein
MTSRQTAELSLTKLLLWIVLIFGISYMPEFLSTLQLDIRGRYPTGDWRFPLTNFLEELSVLFVAINSASNFIIYCIVSAAFRKQLVECGRNLSRKLINTACQKSGDDTMNSRGTHRPGTATTPL